MEDNYQAFLLRLQRTESNGRWRSTLQNVQTGEILRFANEQEMIKHLLESLAQVKDAGFLSVKSTNNNKTD